MPKKCAIVKLNPDDISVKISFVRLIILFALALSGSSIFGLSGTLQFTRLHIAHGYLQGADEPWTPAGPAMDTLFETSFTDIASEFRDMQSSKPSIDFADGYLLPALVDAFVQSPNLTATQPQYLGVNEIEFNLANNFWGCDFHFGLNTCGTYIRQGIAHLIDKTIFVNMEADLKGSASVIDNPLSPGATVPTPTSCGWDSNFPETGSKCIVGGTQPGQASYTGGTAYHLASASGVCVPSALGGCNTYAWMQSNPSPDFCAAAYHIKTGVNMTITNSPFHPGTGFSLANPPGGTFPKGDPSSWTFNAQTDCHLVAAGDPAMDSSTVNSGPVTFNIRTENPTLALLGENYAEEICAIWTGSFTLGCANVPVGNYKATTMDVLNVSLERDVAFSGYSTSTGSGPTKNWGIFTAGPRATPHSIHLKPIHNSS